MVDVFEEVEEQLRSDRYRSLAFKWLPVVGGALALALVAALGYWGYTQYRLKGAEAASLSYAEGLDSLAKSDLATANLRFNDAAHGSSAIYKSLALMQQAAIQLNNSQPAKAADLFDQAAAAAPNAEVADAAKLKAAYALFDTATYDQILARLTPLADTKRPYRALAREAMAMAKLKAGKIADARADFVVLTTVLDAPEDLRQRARAAITLIDGGTAPALPNLVKAAQSLPSGPAAASALAGAGAPSQSPAAGDAQ